MGDFKRRAHDAGVSLKRMSSRTLRVGLTAPERRRKRTRPYRQRTVAMGRPLVDLDKALALAAQFEDEAIARELAARVS